MKKAGLYIHIPFCASKCPYCDFYSVKYDFSLFYIAFVCLKGEERGVIFLLQLSCDKI